MRRRILILSARRETVEHDRGACPQVLAALVPICVSVPASTPSRLAPASGIDKIGHGRGFVANNGQITEFDPPGSTQTNPAVINASGTVAGTFEDREGVTRGFLRDAGGHFTTFVFPVPHSPSQLVTGINNSGEVVGLATSAESVFQGFIREANGKMTLFVLPGRENTIPTGINASGQIAGYAGNFVVDVGFMRDVSGAITTFKAPSAGDTGYTHPTSINDSGDIVGTSGPNMGVVQSFARSGTSEPVEFRLQTNTTALKVNSSGRIAGFVLDGENLLGFFRDVLPPTQ